MLEVKFKERVSEIEIEYKKRNIKLHREAKGDIDEKCLLEVQKDLC